MKGVCVTDVAYAQVNHCFERALVHMYKMPRVWQVRPTLPPLLRRPLRAPLSSPQEYLRFLMSQSLVTKTRHAFDRALRSLPATQHLRWVWPLYVQFAKECGVPETASRIWRRYLKLEPKEVSAQCPLPQFSFAPASATPT